MASRKLSKIQVDDERINRWQDHVLSVVNPTLAKLSSAPAVTGSKGGNAALASLITTLASLGLITDKTT